MQGYNEDGTHPKFFVACGKCYCNVGEAYDSYGEPAYYFSDRQDAAEAWNRRVPDADLVAALEGAIELTELLDEFNKVGTDSWVWHQQAREALRRAKEEA